MDREDGLHHFRRPSSSSSSSGVPKGENNSHSSTGQAIIPGANNPPPAAVGDRPASAASTLREQDQYMPIANVIRIMRRILPPHAKISDDAKETIQECVSEYISFITGEANDRCQREQRKTITADDVLWAMGKLGFDDYVQPLTLFLSRYRELESNDRRPDPPFLRRPLPDFGPAGLGPYAPPHFGFGMPHHHHPPGGFDPNPPGGYAHQGMGEFDPYGHFK